MLGQKSRAGEGASDNGRYEYITELASDALGTSWLARIARGAELGRLVSVRRCRLVSRLTNDLSGLTQRVSAYKELAHASVTRLLSVEASNRELLLVSEYIEGISLGALKQQAFESAAPVPPAVAVRIVLDVARALLAVRRAGADSRLPLPNRVLYVEGIQCAVFGEALLTGVGALSELASYAPHALTTEGLTLLAPEETAAEPTVGDSHEVFSLGALLWELLANRYVAAKSIPARRAAPLVLVPSPADLGPMRALPTQLLELVESATQSVPAARCPSLSELIARIAALPPAFVADEGEVREALLARAGRRIEECRRAAGLPLERGTTPGASPEAAHHSEGDGFDHWEKPTLPGHRLAAPAIVSVSGASQRPSPPRAIVLAPSDATSALPARFSAPPSRRRIPTVAALAVGAVLGAGSLALFLIDSPSSSARGTPHQATAAPIITQAGSERALAQNQMGGADTPPSPAASDSSGDATGPSAKRDNQLDAGPDGVSEVIPPDTGAVAPNVGRKGVYRPRSIAPYRPKGI